MSQLLLIAALTAAHNLDIVRDRLKGLGRVEFAYEGEFERLIDHRTPSNSPPRFSFSGRFTIDVAQQIIIKEHHQPQGETLAIRRVSVTPEFMSTVMTLQNSKAPLSQTRTKGGYLATTSDSPHSIYSWFPTASFLVAGQEDEDRFVALGEEERDGRRCLVLAHRLIRTETKYWIDLERNAVVIAAEVWRNKLLLQTVKSLNVLSHRAGSRLIWLPSTVLTEGHAVRNAKNNGWEPTPTPSVRWTTRLVIETLKINDQNTQVREVQFSRKHPVNDETVRTQSVLRVSANAPPQPKTTAVTTKEVTKTVTEADVRKAELQATLRPPPVDWTQRIAWALIAVGVVGAGWIGYRRVYGVV